MTESEARALADKRNRHKSKHQTNVTWTTQHDSARGWRAVLVPVPAPPPPATISACNSGIDSALLLAVGEAILRERVHRSIGKL